MLRFLLFLFCTAFVQFSCFCYEGPFLVQHLQNAINNAEKGISKLPKEILAINGMSSPKVRHFLNNLCSLPQATYLEIGSWQGSTFISALYENMGTLQSATSIDNWSGRTKKQFEDNCAKHLKGLPFIHFSLDCFAVNPETIIKKPVNIYFYDAGHTFFDQERAFTHYNCILEDNFIAVVDDYNAPAVKKGTISAFKKLGYNVLFEKCLPASFNGDTAEWWNGLYVAVISKPKK